MKPELHQVKIKVLDLAFICQTKRQAEALKQLQIAVNRLEQHLATGRRQLMFDFNEPKSGM